MISFKRARQWLRNRLFRLLNDRDEISNLGLRLWTRHPAVTDKMFFAMSRRYTMGTAEFGEDHVDGIDRHLQQVRRRQRAGRWRVEADEHGETSQFWRPYYTMRRDGIGAMFWT